MGSHWMKASSRVKRLTAAPAIIGLLVLSLALVVAVPGSAATSNGITVTLLNDNGACLASDFLITWDFSAQVADDNGSDLVGMVAYDSDGVPIAADWTGTTPPGFLNRPTTFGGSTSQIHPLTSRLLTIVMFDIASTPPGGVNTQEIYDNILGQSAPVIDQKTVDMSTLLASCGSLPLVRATAVPAVSTCGLAAIALLLGLAGAFWLRRL